MVSHQPVWKPVLTSWPPSSHRSSTDDWSGAKSLPASNAPPKSPSQRNPKLLDLMTTDRSSNICGHEVMWKTGAGPSEGHHWTPCSLPTGQTGLDDAVNMGLHFILQHLYRPGTYVRILFVDLTLSSITPSAQTNSSLCVHLYLSVDHQLPDRQAAASKAWKIHIQHPHHQHWRSSGLCSLPTALLPVHERLHI